MNRKSKGNWKNLREQAEKILKQTSTKSESLDSEKILSIVQEFDIQRIELELQNEELQEAHNQLEKTRNKFQHLFNHAPVGYVVLDENGFVKQVNKTFQKMISDDDIDIINKPFADFLVTSDQRLFHSRFRAFFKTPTNKSMELRFKQTGSRSFVGKLTAVPSVYSLTETDNNLLVTISNINNLKVIEGKLREKSNYLETTLNSVADCVITTDKTGIITRINRTAEKITGWTKKEAIGQSINSILNLKTTVDSPSVDILLDDFDHSEELHRLLISKNGVEYHVSGKFAPIQDTDSSIQGYVLVLRDVTDQFKKNEQLRFHALLLQNISDIVFAIDTEKKLTYTNTAFDKIICKTSENENKITSLENIPLLTENGDHLITVLSTSVNWSGLLYLKNLATGQNQILDCRIQYYPSDNQTQSGWIAVCTDNTEKYIMQQRLAESQKLESIGRLAGGIAHDFNNMLVPVIGYTEMMLDELDESHEYFENLSEVMISAQRLKKIVKQLLAFSRKQHLQTKQIYICRVLDNLKGLIRGTIPENISLNYECSKNDLLIKVDPIQMDQVILNLVLNAKDAMPQGGKLTISVTEFHPDQDFCQSNPGFTQQKYAMISIADTGKGMDQDTIDNIFEPFFTTKGLHGTGLGLATVYGIVKQHKGELLVSSEIEKGSVFKVFIPVVDLKLSKNLNESEQNKEDILKGLKILLVEDDHRVRKMVYKLLVGKGCKVIDCENGEIALNVVTAENLNLDLVVSDVVMPGINGVELYNHLLRLCPGIKVLFMSGYSSSFSNIANSDNFIQKPFVLSDLIKKVCHIMEN